MDLETIIFVLLSTVAAAFAGAAGAQHISESKRRNEVILRELRHTNSCIVVAWQICNTLLTVKSEHVVPLVKEFEKQRASAQSIINDVRFQQGEICLDVTLELRYYSLPELPTEILRESVFGNLNGGRAIVAAALNLSQCVGELGRLLDLRNSWLADHKANSSRTSESSIMRFLGFPDKEGNLDETHANTLAGISTLLDASIFFAMKLSSLLESHAKHIRRKYAGPSIRVESMNFQDAERKGLLPYEEKFKEWSDILQYRPY